jgi:hypothetical protein
MTLQVVGSGLGRTGTMSLKHALEQLGFSRCYHMVEVFMNPPHIPLWIAAAEGKPDWDTLFEGYAATVDYPGARFWRELAAHYPDAKVLHSVRDPEKWFESTQATIFAPSHRARFDNMPEIRRFFETVVTTNELRASIDDREAMIAYFKRHTEAVKAAIPKERLLVWQASDGWEPLCKFLDVPVPATPFPRENSREEFINRTQRAPDFKHLQEEVRKA